MPAHMFVRMPVRVSIYACAQDSAGTTVAAHCVWCKGMEEKERAAEEKCPVLFSFIPYP